jgi:hypothetical protein
MGGFELMSPHNVVMEELMIQIDSELEYMKNRRKLQVTFRTAPEYKDKMDQLVKDKKFNNRSDLINVAIGRLLSRFQD